MRLFFEALLSMALVAMLGGVALVAAAYGIGVLAGMVVLGFKLVVG